MFACIYDRIVSKTAATDSENETGFSPLVDLAFTFSPLVEQTKADTVVFDVTGQDLLFGTHPNVLANELNAQNDSVRNVADEIARRAAKLNLKINIAIAANPDAAIHAARCCKGTTIIDGDDVLLHLAPLSIRKLDYSLARVEADRAEEIQETFALWGVCTFGDLARLPLAGVAERLGQDGVRLQKLAQGKTDRQIHLVRPPIGFEQSLELEDPISELKPFSFILSRLLNQLCANLHEYALATNELRLRLVTERCLEYRLQSGISAANEKDPTEVGVLNTCDLHERTITLPVPMRDPKTLLRLLLFDIEAQPPSAPIIKVSISAQPVKPRASQTGLFIPLAPEPEKLEITLARLAKLVGGENVGSPESLDAHRPDSFRMKRFRLATQRKKSRSNLQSVIRNPQSVMGFRMFRPAWRVDVETIQGKPTRISARGQASTRIRGQVVCAAGPWRGSGDWWRSDVWARDEWDVALVDPNARESKVICRIYRDLTNEQWFVEGIYD